MLATTAVTLLLVLDDELTLLSRKSDSSGSDSSAVSSLCVLGLVEIPIKTYFILKYARYAIRSDYLNLIFWSCAEDLLSYSYLTQN